MRRNDPEISFSEELEAAIRGFFNNYLWLMPFNVISIVLWMPYGFGYYDFPWGNPGAVLLLANFVTLFVYLAYLVMVRALNSPRRLARLIFAGCSLVIACHGLIHFLAWSTSSWTHSE